jgi:hypothetical protein
MRAAGFATLCHTSYIETVISRHTWQVVSCWRSGYTAPLTPSYVVRSSYSTEQVLSYVVQSGKSVA